MTQEQPRGENQPVHVHRETEPGEAVSPEIVPGAVHMEPGGHVQTDDIHVGLVALVGVFSAVALFVMIVGLQAWFFTWDREETERKAGPAVAVQSMAAEHQTQLNGDKPGTEPISRAMETVVERYR